MKQKKQDTAAQVAATQKDSEVTAPEGGAGAVLQVRLSQIMKDELRARAERYGMGVSEYVRVLIFSDLRDAASQAASGDGKSVGQGQD